MGGLDWSWVGRHWRLAQETGVEPACVQLSFQADRSGREYTRVVVIQGKGSPSDDSHTFSMICQEFLRGFKPRVYSPSGL